MSRRRFLKGLAGILATGIAPAVLPSGILMPVRKLWVPENELFAQTGERVGLVREMIEAGGIATVSAWTPDGIRLRWLTREEMEKWLVYET